MSVTPKIAAIHVPNDLTQIEPADVFPEGGRQPAYQIIDVRAPVEIQRSGIPGALSFPILNDEERAAVGACYHSNGQAAAVALGVELTAPHREARVARWREAADSSERPTVFACWRGGKRSGIATQWLEDSRVSRVHGGTKAMRRYLMASLESHVARTETQVISGLTGCGKTELLHKLAKTLPQDILALDLEGLANHRGSAFGGFAEGQPAQQTFENSLAATVHLAAPRITLLEDEARYVGRVEVPGYLHDKIQKSPIILLEATQAERMDRIIHEYVLEPTAHSSRPQVRQELEINLKKLAKRLGGAQLRECLKALDFADDEERWFSPESHTPWVEILLKTYYDKLYNRAVERMTRPILFQGSADEIIAWFEAQS
ncbi:MAG: tRNA 2-selenouridine(34) synthase MnmH [Deltaproteobacteria bacterium]|nr:tRNA 2-selenouridine(34) synthase MnmH [Deltaproteobacteria bacterium]